MRSFADNFSFETYSALIEATEPAIYQKLFAETLIPAFSAFFYELVEAGRIVPMDTLGREIRLVRDWNRAIAKEEYAEYSIRDIAWKLIHHALSMSGRFGPKDQVLQDGYEKFIAQMNEGNVPYTSSENEDAITGERFQLEMENWVPKFFQYVDDFSLTERMSRQPATRLAPVDPISTVEVTFESGEVLAADWFRIEEFTKQTDNDCSINNDNGVREAVQHYANLGFVSVLVGNSSPRIWQRGNTVVAGHPADYDNDVIDGLQGSVTTDLWWVTMIDRKQLERMVGVEVVAKYVADQEPLTLQMTPGTYTVSYSAKYHEFCDNFKTDSFDMTGIEPMFVLELK